MPVERTRYGWYGPAPVRDGDKHQAHHRINYLVKKGRLPRASTLACVDCGGPALDYDHHLGYASSHHFDVQPVCRRCHMKRSVARGETPPPPRRPTVVACVICGRAEGPFRRGRCVRCRDYFRRHGGERPTG